MEKIKYVCIDSNYSGFTVGKIYEGYQFGASKIVADNGFEFVNLSIDDMYSEYGIYLVPLKHINFMIKCTASIYSSIRVGKYYFVNIYGEIITGDRIVYSTNIECQDYQKWYKRCNRKNCAFELIKDYTIYKNGGEEDEVTIVFAQFEGMDSVNVFENKEGSLLTKETKIRVVCGCRELDACVVSSIKIKRKYVIDLVKAVCRDNPGETMPIIGVYKQVTREELVEL